MIHFFSAIHFYVHDYFIFSVSHITLIVLYSVMVNKALREAQGVEEGMMIKSEGKTQSL